MPKTPCIAKFNMRVLMFTWLFVIACCLHVATCEIVRVTEDMPAYHFRPPKNWMSDPNGPMFYNGYYHFFYQYNKNGPLWGDMIWGHGVSKDLINWKIIKPAIERTKPYDIFGCYSGSATIVPGKGPIVLYTGVDKDKIQSQVIALPANISDPYLQEWTKPLKKPFLEPYDTINPVEFRDPSVAWKGIDGLWRMMLSGSSLKDNKTGHNFQYKSKDFIHWKRINSLHDTKDTGMLECLDIFPVYINGSKLGLDMNQYGPGIKHVYKVSLDDWRWEYYTVGKYDRKADTYTPEKQFVDGLNGLRYDWGSFYASKSFFDSWKNRRILWGWCNESDGRLDDVVKGWNGVQAIPRQVWLHKSGRQLVQWPVKELETLRGKKIEMNNIQLKKGQHVEVTGITANQADVVVIFSVPNLTNAEPFDPSYAFDPLKYCKEMGSNVHGGVGPFGLLTLASKNLEEYTPVFFRIFKAPRDNYKVLLCADARSSSLKKAELYKPSFGGFVDVNITNRTLSLRSLIDHNIVENFGAWGKTCVTIRTYPTTAIFNDTRLFLFNNGSETITIQSLTAWSMKNATISFNE